MVVPYIVAVFVWILAHVHLLGLDERIAVRGRLFWTFRGGTAVEIILLVLHCCMDARMFWWELVLNVGQ
jgi:NADH:ubiquinone oxidoreductase subunit 6 (subunit J)